MDKIEFRYIDTGSLELNEGQIEGLERNPRQWTFEDVEHLKKSIEETPELLEARGLIVIEHNGVYVTIGGNMRLTALRSLGTKNAPCIVLPKNTSVGTLQEIAIKDNGQFGRWDIEALKAEWNDCPFVEWGCKVFDFPAIDATEDKSRGASNVSGDDRAKYSIVLSSEEFEYVNCKLRDYDKDPSEAFLIVMGYYDDGRA